MARKRKVMDEKSAPNEPAQANDAKKRKIDWSTVDQAPKFEITAVNIKTQKKPSKLAKTNQGAARGRHVDTFDSDPLDGDIEQSNPFPEVQLSGLHVKITPALYWESTTRYRRFTMNGEEFQAGQMVFVKKSEEDITEGPDAIQHWLAKILEIRGGDPSHVYLRVFWAYRPEDVPGGRQAHHGDSELIVSNHMDIIEAETVESSADVVYWDDDPSSLSLYADQLFFRQSYDITKRTGSQFSKLKTYCVDKKPCNPDELIIQCPHCSEWLHSACLKKRVLRDAALQQKKQGRPSKLQAPATLDAKLRTKQTKTRLTILEKHEGEPKYKWDVDIPCLVCDKIIEEASDKARRKFAPRSSAALPSDDALANDETNITPTKAFRLAKTHIQDDDADSIIGDAESDRDLEARDPSRNHAEIKVPRRRGRPPGSKNKRKRTSWGPTKKFTLPHAKYLKTETGKEGVPLHTTHDMITSTAEAPIPRAVLESARKATATTPLASTNDATPQAQPRSPQLALQPASISFKSAEDALPTTAHQTPAPAPINESVFQSGVRSVKKFLWRGS